VAARVGVTVAALSRLLGRGGGSVIGGRAILAIDPGALGRLLGGRAVALVSGTNGKTTTTSLLGAAMATAGPLTTNVLGANQPPGLAAALAAGAPGGSAALEVDEAWMERVVAATDPEVVLLLNLSRDQLDRNNEVRQLVARWRRTFEGRETTLVVANADDPLVAWSAMAAPRVCWVGAGQPWTEDAAGCPSCGARVIFAPGVPPGGPSDPPAGPAIEGAQVEGAPIEAAGSERKGASPAGGWRCSGCDLHRPDLDLWLEDDEVVTAQGWRRHLNLALPGRANRANAAMALAAARHLGVDPASALDAMAGAKEIVGRYSGVEVGDFRARLLLAKNPAGWLEVLDVLRPGPEPVVVAINARIADGRDPSWLWDVPFERLAGRLVIASGERGRDLAVRLHYADVEHRLVLDPLEAVRAAGEAARQERKDESRGAVEIDVVGNYTSFQVLRTRLGR
jgi:lipid II isoglutaminyl synthase (glutamine-hydrolysing)